MQDTLSRNILTDGSCRTDSGSWQSHMHGSP